MTAKEILQSIKEKRIAIDAKREKISVLRSIAEKTTAGLDGMPHGPRKETSSLETVVCKIIDQEKELEDLIRERDAVIELVCSMSGTDEVTVLMKRYIQEETWEEIAVDMNYSRAQCFRIHSAAVESFSKHLNDETV